MAIRLGDILVENKVITPEELKLAVIEQQKTKKLLGEVLLNMGLVTERKLLSVLAKQQGLSFIDLKKTVIDEKVIKAVPAKFVWHHKVMPVSINENILVIAISNLFESSAVEDLEAHLGLRVETVLALSSDIKAAINQYYGVGAETVEKILSQDLDSSTMKEQLTSVDDIQKMSEDASVVKLVNQILHQAITKRATDVHIEIFRNELALRYRVDGILYDAQVPETIKYLYPAIISRIKVMAGIDIVERRLPQDGRAKVRISDTEYELRVSVIPTLYGENIVIRILPVSMLFDINSLGIGENDLNTIMELIQRPNGIIFVTGPTGSGKTTSLYACLSKLNTRERKILTIEDPVEYELKGISQTQINPKIGVTFSMMLRSMLRHDPDVMMVGEVRDFETAEITIQTALTGHLVFSTLHTNDAASGVTRLIDIGIEPYLISSSVVAFVAQRLVRVICSKCKESVKYQNQNVFRGKGCNYCNNTGYFGRTGIYEILIVTDEIRKLILNKVSSDVIKKEAVSGGMKLLRDDGWAKVLAGITTVDEIMRVTQ